MSLTGGKQILNTLKSNQKRKNRIESKIDDSFELIPVNDTKIQRRELRRRVKDALKEFLTNRLIFLRESHDALVKRICTKEINAPSKFS